MNLYDILNLQRLECTGDVARAGWVLDQDAILEAMDSFNLKLNVKIRFMTGKYRLASHRISKSKTHKITLDQNKSIKDSNISLWHELVHCKQAEEWADKYDTDIRDFWTFAKSFGYHTEERYRGNPFEVEAREISENTDIMLLAYAS